MAGRSKCMARMNFIGIILMIPVLNAEAHDIEIVYPPNSGVFNVVADGGLDNSGATDVTARLQTILDERPRTIQVVYFPKGTYLVSGQLRMKRDRSRSPSSHSHGPWLVGQSRAETIIRLKDGTWPEPVYALAPDPDDNGRYPKKIDEQVVLSTGDCTNTTFNKIIRNMTICTGKNNAGAIGVMYNTSNSGFLGEVDIISEDGQGVAGLALAGVENGPGQVRNVRIKGFDVGIYNITDYVTACSHVRIEQPNTLGILNHGITAGEDFTIVMKIDGPAIKNVKRGMFCLIGAAIEGRAENEPAIESDEDGMLYLRDIRTEGFAGAVKKDQHDIGEFYTGQPAGLFYQPKTALRLPIKTTPKLPDYEEDFSKWTNPMDFGAAGDGKADDTEAVSKAMSTPGKSHVVFPYDKKFRITKSITIGPDVARIVGTSGNIWSYVKDNNRIIIEDGVSPIVILEGISLPPVVVRTGRTVILDSISPGYRILGSSKEQRGKQKVMSHFFEGTGDVFMNNDPMALEVTNPRQSVWIRHYNNEWGPNTPTVPVQVRAGRAWILGWKSENLAQRVRVEGGSLEITGFNNYRVGTKKNDGDWPIFEILGGSFSCNGLVQRGSQSNCNLVWETRDGETRKLTADNNPGKRQCPLYTGYKP